MALLEVKDLRTVFHIPGGTVRAVDGVTFRIEEGRTLGLVGESGCGKTVTALSILRLIPSPPGEICGGMIIHDGDDLLRLSESRMRRIRGNEISMIFQEPASSLNPVFTVGNQIGEAIALHQGLRGKELKRKVIDMLERVGIPSPAIRLNDYPHQMSGGMQQRVMIAMALSCRPKILIADEPTTALDVTIQAQILDLLRKLQDETGMAILLITHDLGVVAVMADDVAVMYGGVIVETGEAADLYHRPFHPYTIGLLESIPDIREKGEKLKAIPGSVPSPLDLPPGCRFYPRCRHTEDVCGSDEPALREVEPGRYAACHFAEKIRNGR